MKLLHVFFISLYAIASASKIEFDKLKFVIQTLGEHPKNRHPSVVLGREKRQIDSDATAEIVNPTSDASTDKITPAADIPSSLMTTIVEWTTTSEEIATTTKVPSTLSVSTGDPASTVLSVNPSTEATTLAAEASILTDQHQTVDTLKNSITEATTAGEIIPSSESTIADGGTLTSISKINNAVYVSSPALETIVNVDPKQMSIPAAELILVPIESTIPAMEPTVVTVEPTAKILFDDLSIEAATVPIAIIPASSAETASSPLTLDAVIPAEEKTTDVDMRITLTTESAIPIETTTQSSTPPSFPTTAFEKNVEDQITKIKDRLEHATGKEIEKVKETWAMFKFYLMDSLVPGSKSNNIAARYARFPLSNAEEIKRNLKLFSDFTERIQRKPGYQLEKVMNSWEKVQKILESYPGVSPNQSQPKSSSTTEIPNQVSTNQ